MISDEMLMAYADGELDADDALSVSAAIAADADLAARYEAHQQLRLRMRKAYAAALQEPVPERLVETARNAAGADVVDLAAHRAARAMPLPHPAAARQPARPGWAQWGGLAASLAIGIVLGSLLDFGARSGPDFETTAHGLAARGAIADALSNRLASSAVADADAVRLQISFLDRDGNYCRSFSTAALAGLACRSGGEWSVQQLIRTAPAPATAMRQAGAALPTQLLEAIEQGMQGGALDAQGERAALERGWQR